MYRGLPSNSSPAQYLLYAARTGNLELLESHLENNIHKEGFTGDYHRKCSNGAVALKLAVQEGMTDVVKMLLENGVDANEIAMPNNKYEYSALHFACQDKHRLKKDVKSSNC